MAKAKKKRALKESNKLWRTGKYWEWLRLVEQEGSVAAQAAQWQEAWRNLSRRALRLPAYLEEFWQRLPELKNIPDNPDIVFIRRLKDFLADKDVRPEITALTGLSPAARLLREKLQSWSWDPAKDKKVGRFIKLLVKQPDKVTARTFNELATLLDPNPLSESIRSLSKTITQVRKFNSQAAVKRGGVGMSARELKILDSRLERLAGSFNPVLREVLLYPFLFQAVQLFTRLAARENFDELSYLAAVLPFIFSQAAGSRTEDLKNRCRLLSGTIATEQEAIDYLQKALPQDLETRVVALAKVRLALKSLDPSDRLLRMFYHLYERLLDDIGQRQSELSPRERLELMQVMDPIIFTDLEWFMEGSYDIRFFIKKAFTAGCGGTLISTLALLTAEITADLPLKQKAIANLQKLPYPGDQQLLRVLEGFVETIFPHIRLIKPLIEVYPTEANLRKFLFNRVLTELKVFLFTNAKALEFEKAISINKARQQFLQDTWKIFKSELNALQNYEETIVLQDMAECFSEGYLTTNGYRQLFLKIYNRCQSLDYLFSQLDNYFIKAPEAGHTLDELLLNIAAEGWQDKQEELLFQFVIDRRPDLQTASLNTIERLVDRFCQLRFMEPKGLNFFLRLSSLLEKRVRAGESAAGDLQERIMFQLLKYRKSSPATRRARR